MMYGTTIQVFVLHFNKAGINRIFMNAFNFLVIYRRVTQLYWMIML